MAFLTDVSSIWFDKLRESLEVTRGYFNQISVVIHLNRFPGKVRNGREQTDLYLTLQLQLYYFKYRPYRLATPR